jgi:N6-adenosine-specific RNA methylase IME4
MTDASPSGHNLSREQWAERLNETWASISRGAVEGYIDFGHELIECRRSLPHGEWESMVTENLSFHPHVARMFIRIAQWEQTVGTAYDLPRILPPDYTTIDKLTRLDNETFGRLVDEGIVCPSLKRNEVSRILRLERVNADEARILNLRPIIGKFRTIILDPAWDYDWLSIAARAKPGYAMQTREQLEELDVRAWADESVGCHLYVWTTNNFMAEACELIDLWGFQHRTVLTWIKPPPFGLGSYFRNSTEHCIFATLGDTTTRPAASSIATHFEAPRGEHSEKPERFYDLVRAASYPPFGEGNQREPRPDFTNLFEEVATQGNGEDIAAESHA